MKQKHTYCLLLTRNYDVKPNSHFNNECNSVFYLHFFSKQAINRLLRMVLAKGTKQKLAILFFFPTSA